jgi:hypothetical protein
MNSLAFSCVSSSHELLNACVLAAWHSGSWLCCKQTRGREGGRQRRRRCSRAESRRPGRLQPSSAFVHQTATNAASHLRPASERLTAQHRLASCCYWRPVSAYSHYPLFLCRPLVSCRTGAAVVRACLPHHHHCRLHRQRQDDSSAAQRGTAASPHSRHLRLVLTARARPLNCLRRAASVPGLCQLDS